MILIVELPLILFGSVFQAFAADTVNGRTPHEFLELLLIAACLQSAYFHGVDCTV